MTTKLAVEHVFKVFGDNPDDAMARISRGEDKDQIFEATGMTVGVSDASFDVREGEVFVVMGLSGSGKSTLVRMLNRLIEPTSGSIRLEDRDLTRMSRKDLIAVRRREISMVFQSFALMPHQTVIENTVFGLSVSGVGKAERNGRALEALEAVGLKANARSYPDELSGGMKQRVGLARALAINPSILLMDEAFSALDPLIRTEMQDELLRLQKEQARTVIFITHDLDEAMRVGDRIAIMEGGRIVQIGAPAEIVREPADDYVSSFFKGVDVSHVFTAGDVASRDEAAMIEAGQHDVAAALQLVERDRNGLGVVVGDGLFKGLVTTGSLANSPSDGRLEDACINDAVCIDASEPLGGLLTRVGDSRYPLVVRDDDSGRYVGVLSARILLHTLSRSRDDEGLEENDDTRPATAEVSA